MTVTVHGGENNSRVVVSNNVGITVLWLVDLQVGVLPCELLAWINRLQGGDERTKRGREKERNLFSLLRHLV